MTFTLIQSYYPENLKTKKCLTIDLKKRSGVFQDWKVIHAIKNIKQCSNIYAGTSLEDKIQAMEKLGEKRLC